jgi:hypothetical protein
MSFYKKNDRVNKNTTNRVLHQISKMAEKVDTSSALTDVAEHFENEVSENELPGTEVSENDVKVEPEWYRDGDAWVKIFLEPIAPGKFKQHDYIYNVPGTNEFPKENWSSAECKDGFHITRRKDVWAHLPLHGFKSAYIAEVVSMGDEFYDNPREYKRKVRVVTFGPAVPLTEVLGKHPDDFKHGQMLKWSVRNNHLEMAKLAVSKESVSYTYSWMFELALVNGNEQIADVLIENCDNEIERQNMLREAISHGCVDLVKRLMENTSVDVSFYRVACNRGQFEIFELLRAKYGDPKCSDIIVSALFGGNVDILKYLKSRGVDMTDFEMFVYTCTNCAHLQTIKYLVSAGANVKHPLIVYIAKIYALHKEVREYLLTQIDDKSEVPECERLDDEIVNIRNTFYKRIGTGEFDRV